MRALLIAMVGLVVAGVAQAEITPLEQERFWSQNDYKESAPDFGYFESGVGLVTNHTSDILPLELWGELNGESWGEGDVGLSFYRVEFNIDDTTEYALTADLHAFDPYDWFLAEVELTLSIYETGLGDYEPLLHYVADLYHGNHHVVSETGTLAPGQYQLEVSALGTGKNHSEMGDIGGTGRATFSLTVSAASPELPTLSPWSQLALVAGLLGAGLGVWRRRAALG